MLYCNNNKKQIMKTYLVTCQFFTSLENCVNEECKHTEQFTVSVKNEKDIIVNSYHELKLDPRYKNSHIYRFLITFCAIL